MQYAYIHAFISRFPIWHGLSSPRHRQNPYAPMGDAPGAKCKQCKLYKNDMLPKCAICTYRYLPLIPTILLPSSKIRKYLLHPISCAYATYPLSIQSYTDIHKSDALRQYMQCIRHRQIHFPCSPPSLARVSTRSAQSSKVL